MQTMTQKPLKRRRKSPVQLLRDAIEAAKKAGIVGSTRQYATEVLTRDERTVRRWLAGDTPIPRAVVEFLERQAQ